MAKNGKNRLAILPIFRFRRTNVILENSVLLPRQRRGNNTESQKCCYTFVNWYKPQELIDGAPRRQSILGA
ncbi:hypothetical protein [Pseudanabaena galeata]|jgi:hypothetical protein|uniref:hypothetical protein n=1 Tax=Pseudanabaena galeata TaxID=1112103 RepID=UPI0024791CED|nr:hypothetical protein [Pseudanabaena galeata]WGS72042.1 hypothetical protein OA858_20405 [Pseudanabaena galeata CCNP1313]